MNEIKLSRLLGAARKEPTPEPGPGFDLRVMRAIGREERPGPASWFDQLGELWPQVAAGAVVVIGLCVAADFCLTTYAQTDLSASLAEASEQWLFAVR